MVFQHDDYAVAWICALPLEMAAAKITLDKIHPTLPQPETDHNAYTLGNVGGHNVVVACLPSGVYGTTSAAIVLAQMLPTFPCLRFALMVGIGGGVPNQNTDVRLGDVVVSIPTATSGGVIQYDHGKTLDDGRLHRTGSLNKPPQYLLTAISQIRSDTMAKGSQIPWMNKEIAELLQQRQESHEQFRRPAKDWLFNPNYDHRRGTSDCSLCDESQLVVRTPRETMEPMVHYGLIASGNRVMKDARTRDSIAKELQILCFEMEAAGLMDQLPCLVVRGICDYSDSHKHKEWQEYAALTAAAYANLVLLKVPATQNTRHLKKEEHTVFRNIPFPKNEGFVGRGGQLSQLEELLFSPGRQRKVAITGLGGVGKTQVALEFAYRTQQSRPGCSIYWISATNLETLERTYFHIAQQLRLPGLEEEGADVKKLLKDYLCGSSAGQWLLIFDNADDIDMWFGKSKGNTEPCRLSDCIPWSRTGSVLFTTRFKKVASKLAMQDVIRVPEMDEVKALELLSERLVDKSLLQDRDQAALLLKQLVYLPLAIVQAASYINENCLGTLSDYLSLLLANEEEVINLLSEEFKDDWRPHDTTNPVAATWLISFERVQRTNPLATDILSFMACIEPTEIPESLLPPAASRKAWVESIGILEGYAFVTRRPTKSFDLHRLVHLATRNWLRENKTLFEWTLTTLTRLEEIFPNDDHTNRDMWKTYLPHALGLLVKDEVQGIRHRYELLYKVSICLLADGRATEAVKYLEEHYDWHKREFDEEHPSRLASQHELAGAYQANGQIKQAVELLEHVVTVKRTLAEEHPSRLASQHELARVYRANGQIKQAVELLEHVVTVRERTLAEEHPDRLASQHVLAGAYQANGQIKQAVELLEHVVTVKRTLAEEHPDRLASQHALAMAYQDNGQVKQAVELLEYVVTVERTLAEEHPSRLASQHELATAYKDNGEIKQAVELLEHVVIVEKRTLAEEHPDRLASQHELARAYQANGQIKQAVELLEHVVTVRERTLAEEHPDRLASQHVLAGAYQANGQVKQAVELLEHVVTVRERTLAEEHPDRLASQHVLAQLLA
ncbi:hypothetical protein BDV06DRAFT_221210 [Aspergillus oleicola]